MPSSGLSCNRRPRKYPRMLLWRFRFRRQDDNYIPGTSTVWMSAHQAIVVTRCIESTTLRIQGEMCTAGHPRFSYFRWRCFWSLQVGDGGNLDIDFWVSKHEKLWPASLCRMKTNIALWAYDRSLIQQNVSSEVVFANQLVPMKLQPAWKEDTLTASATKCPQSLTNLSTSTFTMFTSRLLTQVCTDYN